MNERLQMTTGTHDESHPGCARQRGFTLVELLAVIAIMGVMLTMAAVAIASDPDVEDIGHRISGLVEEASRKAVAGGPMTADAIASEGTKARTRVRIYGVARNQAMITERYDDASGEWLVIANYRIPTHIDVVGFREQVELDPGAAPTHALAGGNQVHLECLPRGSCVPASGGSGMTVYMRDIDNPRDEARVIVIPVGGAPMVLSGW